jgi:hypothetical protein
MLEFSKWFRKSHPDFLREEDLNANQITNQQTPNAPDVAGAVNIDSFSTAPTPDDFKNEAMQSGKEILQAYENAAKKEFENIKRQMIFTDKFDKKEFEAVKDRMRVSTKLDKDTIDNMGSPFSNPKLTLFTHMTAFTKEQKFRLNQFINNKAFTLLYYLMKMRSMWFTIRRHVRNKAKNQQEENNQDKLLDPIYEITTPYIRSNSIFIQFIIKCMQANNQAKQEEFDRNVSLFSNMFRIHIDRENDEGASPSTLEQLEEDEMSTYSGYIPEWNEMISKLANIQSDVNKMENALNDVIKNRIIVPKKIEDTIERPAR